MTRLYYEAHITIEPVFDGKLEEAEVIARTEKFKLANLLMQKRSSDTPTRSKNDTFMTGHSTDYQDLYVRTKNLVNLLSSKGFSVWRFKIEDTLLDSKKDGMDFSKLDSIKIMFEETLLCQ